MKFPQTTDELITKESSLTRGEALLTPVQVSPVFSILPTDGLGHSLRQ